MTEIDWLVSKDLEQLLLFLQFGGGGHRATSRKLRLFMCGCCRRIWNFIPNKYCRKAVEVAERYADGLVCDKILEDSWYTAFCSCESLESPVDYYAGNCAAHTAFDGPRSVSNVPRYACSAISEITKDGNNEAIQTEREAQLILIHDVFGNPFHPLPFINLSWLAWNGGIIPRLAQVIYDNRRFSDMPVLADALEEAGCTNAAILDHCRGETEHVRGCWVIDQLLRGTNRMIVPGTDSKCDAVEKITRR